MTVKHNCAVNSDVQYAELPCAMCCVQFVVYSIQCEVWSFCAVCSVHCEVCSVQCKAVFYSAVDPSYLWAGSEGTDSRHQLQSRWSTGNTARWSKVQNCAILEWSRMQDLCNSPKCTNKSKMVEDLKLNLNLNLFPICACAGMVQKVTRVRCQVTGVRWQVTSDRCQVTGDKIQVAGDTWHIFPPSIKVLSRVNLLFDYLYPLPISLFSRPLIGPETSWSFAPGGAQQGSTN